MSFLIDATLLSRGGRRVGSTGGDTEAPSIPQNLVATAASDSQIDLTWDASTDNVGVTGYKIYRDSSFLVEVAGTTHSDTGLQASTQYTYEVSAVDAAGNESAKSTSDSATTNAQASDPVLQPTNADLAVGWTLADDHVTTPDGAADNLTGLGNLFASDRAIWMRPGGVYSVGSKFDVDGINDVFLQGNGAWLRRLDGQDDMLMQAATNGIQRWDINEFHLDGNRAGQSTSGVFKHNFQTRTSSDVVSTRCNNKLSALPQGDGWAIQGINDGNGNGIAGTECVRHAQVDCNGWDHGRLVTAVIHCHDHQYTGGWLWGMNLQGPAGGMDWEPNPGDDLEMCKQSMITGTQIFENGGGKNPGGSNNGEPRILMAYGWQISRCGPWDGISPLQPASITNRSRETNFIGLQMWDNLADNNGTAGGTRLWSPVIEQGINGGSILLADWIVFNCKRDDAAENAIHDFWIRSRRMRHNIDGSLPFFTAMFMDLLFDTRGIGVTEESNCINIDDDLRHLHGLMVIGASNEFSTGISLSNGASSNVEGLIDGCLIKTGASGAISSPASVSESHNIEAGA